MDQHHQKIIDIDYHRPGIPHTANVLQPAIFRDGRKFLCVLGTDRDTAISGRGNTPESAIQDWDRNLHKRIGNASDGDQLVAFVNDALKQWESARPVSVTKDAGTGKGRESTADRSVADELGQPDKSIDDLPAKKHSTNESSIDGSEFR